MKQLTIAITCYKEGNQLLECWDSVLNQSDSNWNAVMVLDGGHDKQTEKVFDSIKHKKLKKLKINSIQGTYPESRNISFRIATSDYIYYLDADDQLEPNAVFSVLNTFKNNPEIAFVYGNIKSLNDDRFFIKLPKKYGKKELVKTLIHQGGWAYRKDIWNLYGPFRKIANIKEGPLDFDFHLTLYENQLYGKHCGQVLYNLRTNQSLQLSCGYNIKKHIPSKCLIKNHKKFFNNNKIKNILLGRTYSIAAEAYSELSNTRRAQFLARCALKYKTYMRPIIWYIALTGKHPGRYYKKIRRLVYKYFFKKG